MDRDDQLLRNLGRYTGKPVTQSIPSIISLASQAGIKIQEEGTTLKLYTTEMKKGFLGRKKSVDVHLLDIMYQIENGNISEFSVGEYNPSNSNVKLFLTRLRG